MDDLIEALTILRKYDNPGYPTHCEHDVLMVLVDPSGVSQGDLVRLEKLGFFAGNEEGTECFKSFRFGSA